MIAALATVDIELLSDTLRGRASFPPSPLARMSILRGKASINAPVPLYLSLFAVRRLCQPKSRQVLPAPDPLAHTSREPAID